MIRFLQKEGPFKKFVLGGILVVICAAMVIAFVPGGLGSELTGTPGKGVIAKVDGTDVTADEVRLAARNMAQQQAQRYGEMAAKIMPFIIQNSIKPAADQLITRLDLQLLEQLDQSIARIEKTILAVVKLLPNYQVLQTMPGVGIILGLTITLETAGPE